MVNYTGNPTATQLPAPQPHAGAVAVVALPQDTVDPLNESTIDQLAKMPTDWLTWLMAPTARSTQWAEDTHYWQNALGQKKFRVDHMGYPAGAFQQLVENWRGQDSQVGTGSGTFNNTNLRWAVAVTSTVGGQVVVSSPDITPTFLVRNVQIEVGSGAADVSQIYAQELTTIFATTQGIAIEWDLRTDISIDQMHFSCGVADIPAGNYQGPTAGFAGMAFFKGNANADWMVVCGDGTALATAVDSGVAVAATTHYKMRLEYLGSGVADDGVSAVRAYINNVLVATITTHVPTTVANHLANPFFSMTRDSGSTQRLISLGPVRMTQNY